MLGNGLQLNTLLKSVRNEVPEHMDGQVIQALAALGLAASNTVQAATYQTGECAECGRHAKNCGKAGDSCAIGWLRKALKDLAKSAGARLG